MGDTYFLLGQIKVNANSYTYGSVFVVKSVCRNVIQQNFLFCFDCAEVLRPCQQLRSCQAGQLPINTVPGQA